VGLLAEKYHKLPSEIVDPEGDLSPIGRLMLDSQVSARVDRWMKRELERGESVSVVEKVRREQAEWQRLRLVS